MRRRIIKTTTQATKKRGQKNRLPIYFVMTDPRRLPDPIAVVRSLPSGWGFILRHYDEPNRDLLARRLSRICRDRGIVFLVAGDWRLARRVCADGVHIPEGMMKRMTMAPVRLWRRGGGTITTSAHGALLRQRLSRKDVDAVLLSPVERTESHPERRPIGRLPFAAFVRTINCPVYALGGMTRAHVKTIMALGGAGIAGIGFVKSGD